jgi:HAD superfamily hydrolase (TIGR01509 family)
VAGVLFDWDGVLLDSLGAAFNVYDRIFSRIGTKRLTKDEFLEVQSPNWYDFYVKVGVPKALWKEVDAEWVRLYKDESPELHPDARRCLKALSEAGLKLALVSNGSRARVEDEIGGFGLRPFFQSIECGEKIEELKPSPTMINRALGVLSLRPMEVVYVGDSPADIQASKNSGVPSIGLARGPIQAERLRMEKPDRVFAGLDEVTQFLLGPG